MYKFEKLRIYQLSLDYIDLIYELVELLPTSEQHNLRSQIVRAATSVALNIAEGSTGLTNNEQARFLSMANRSLLESVACLQIIQRRKYFDPRHPIVDKIHQWAQALSPMIQAMRNTVLKGRRREKNSD